MTSNLGETGKISWELALCLLLAWLIVFLVLTKGIKTLGKVRVIFKLSIMWSYRSYHDENESLRCTCNVSNINQILFLFIKITPYIKVVMFDCNTRMDIK